MDVVRKRVVMQHHTGRLAGLHQILGTLEGEHAASRMPPALKLKGGQAAHHARTTERAIYYREWAQASVGAFNDFNPAQV